MTARSLGTVTRTPHTATITARGLLLLLIVVVLAVLAVHRGVAAEHGPVHVAEITGEIDLGIAPFLDRALTEARDDGASAMVLVIDTPGGRLDAVLQMRDSLLASPVRTIAYIDRNAFSAGALVALASEEIHMAPGAVMGAATPVDATGIPADEKVISAVRSTFGATAEERGRDPLVAEAMVDPAVEIEGLVARGSLLTLTVSEATETGYADGLADDLPALLASLDLDDRVLVRSDPSLAERVVRFITNPVIASLLITLGILLFLGDLLSGGIGVGAGAGALLLGTFFWGHLLAGLTGWEDVALVVIGLGLILVEILVVPGFGVPGILGLAAVLGGSFLAMLNRDFEFVGSEQILRSGLTVAVSFVAITAGLIGVLSYLSRRGGPPGLVLRSQAASGPPATDRPVGWLRWFGDGSVLAPDQPLAPSEEVPTITTPHHRGPLTGAVGVALSDLRPAGLAQIGGRRIDVITEGEYIRSGERVEIIIDEGYRRVVRRPPVEEPLPS
jgi:membrane-bound serine protease (ClpP class)